MKLKNVSNKSVAIRMAINESLQQLLQKHETMDFNTLLGQATLAPQNKHPRFKSDKDLWE